MEAKAQRTQGKKKSRKLLLLEQISKLKMRIHHKVRQENVQDVIKYSYENILFTAGKIYRSLC